MLRVFPGVAPTWASLVPSSALISVDFPTFERPATATSGIPSGGS